MTFSELPQRKGFLWLLVVITIGFLLYMLREALVPFAAALVLSYLLQPIVDKLQQRKIPRWLGSSLVLIGAFLLVTGIVMLILPVLSAQVGKLIEIAPTYIQQIEAFMQPYIAEYAPQLLAQSQELASSQGGKALSIVGNFLGKVLSGSFAALNIISLAVLTPIVTFYLLRDWPYLTQKIDNLWPRYYYDTIKAQLSEVDKTLAGFMRGQFLVCMLLGTFYAIALSLAGLDFAIAIGLLSGLLSFIPYVGSIIGGVSSLGMALAQFGFNGWVSIAIVAAIFAFGQFVEGNILSPKLVGERVNLHPVWIIFALFIGGSLFGFLGVLLAVPVAAVIGVLIRFSITEYQKSKFYQH